MTTTPTDEPDPVIYIQNRTRRDVRLFKVGSARAILADFTHGKEACVYTFGQFSLVDALAAILEKTGPADIDICVWTVGAADLQRVMHIADPTRVRWVLDQGFQTRAPEYLEQMRDLYGDQRIRTIRAHAKFITIGNDRWNVVIRTSMNLNRNTRFEHLDVVDDPGLHAWHRDVVDGIFEAEPEGDYEPKGLSDITGVPDTKPRGMVTMGLARVGTAGTGKFGTGV
ncbi:hypothetical protein [Tomitella fengzijianii]|uniref:Phospholipase D-like domain-containing protein n=1 Tax=Tomitella fengzijianii TaxID=2597660 RepID=A0A516X4J5_9ACTN|nr:hypothetical protein [Tomitella fengzijianii]QDQ97970.1 hypothetical protein FO059_12405 [Tomitella fengzijianii]